MIKVLVTGSGGLVGKSLQKIVDLKNTSRNVKFYFLTKNDCDLLDVNAVYLKFCEITPDVVIHLASMVGGVYENINNNYTLFLNNIRINTNIIDACNRYHVKKLINILSTCIFPDKNIKYPLTPDQVHNGAPHDSNMGYAYSKRVLHIGASLLPGVKDGNMKVINIIPTNLYGENDNYNIPKAHVIPALIHKTYLASKNNTPLVISGSGNALRQFLYADDLCNIIYDLSLNNSEQTPCVQDFIICPPKTHEISIKQIINKIVNIFDFKGDIIYDTTVTDGQLKKTSQSSEEYVDYPFTNINVGLIDTIGYFVKNYNDLRI
jgi:GDP-L-fucose synthase